MVLVLAVVLPQLMQQSSIQNHRAHALTMQVLAVLSQKALPVIRRQPVPRLTLALAAAHHWHWQLPVAVPVDRLLPC
jgi:hypothetical protein